MKLGLGLYKHQLTPENFAFARQAGCTHLIVHLANYYEKEIVTATNEHNNYGKAVKETDTWSLEYMQELQHIVGTYGLSIYGIENFSPADWFDVLLDGPKRAEQMETLKQIIRNVGKAGIKTFGYNFSIAGVWGHSKKPLARGGAETVCFNASELSLDAPIPNGQIWNMTYDDNAKPGFITNPTSLELWDRLRRFLEELLPVAEEAGVELALHPDDPPMPMLRGTPRMVYQPWMYQKLLDMNPSKANKIEFCMGSIQEMSEGDLYESIEQYASQGKISYVHFRNVVGKVPKYCEVFVDEGDIDMKRAIKLLDKYGFDGVLVPDHTPMMAKLDPWHTGMAFALGYMKALLDGIEEES
ncbi:MAG: mannonate dehydratase [Sphaerochaetaceae bacterium]